MSEEELESLSKNKWDLSAIYRIEKLKKREKYLFFILRELIIELRK
jgi:hypothetical protein